MDKLLETVMNFINENTTLLIIICVFLIFVLIGYLIDNSVKTKKLEKQMLNNENEVPENNTEIEGIDDSKDKVDSTTIDPNTEINLDFRTPEEIEQEKNESTIDPNMEINLDFRTPEEIEQENNEPTIDPNMEINLDFRTPEEIEKDNEKKEFVPTSTNEVTVDPAINDLLLRDFATNGVNTYEEEKDDVTINPIHDVVSINDIDIPSVPEVEESNDSVYKNDKKLSDIFKKKSDTDKTINLEKTEDYSNELDKILKKLNETSNSKDSTLEETTDFTNMF